MQANRRKWLKQISLGVAGISLSQFRSFAEPAQPPAAGTIADGLIKLNANENPYGPSPMARLAMAQHNNLSNRYGWDINGELIEALAQKNKITADNILLGAGSTELLDLTARFAATKKGSLIIAAPSYGYWTGAAEKNGLQKIEVPLTPDKKIDLPAMLKAIQEDTRLIYICNPNNPTGTVCEQDALLQFINEATKKTLVLVDEAYIDFTSQLSLAGQVTTNKNLVIAKTFSKIYGLAGARTGYAIAHSSTMEQIAALQSWNNGSVSVVSAAAALASLKDEKFIAETFSLNEKARKYTIEQLQQLNITCIPSSANFLYFSLSGYKQDYFKKLEDAQIIGTRFYEENGKWTRITVGTMEEMQQFIRAIK